MHGTQSRISQSEQAGIGDYLVCRSPMMVKLATRIRRYATATAPVLITGPSGSGKEHVARALHGLSARKAMPMLAVNCAAIPPALLESELFGTRSVRSPVRSSAPVGLNVRTEGHSSSMRLEICQPLLKHDYYVCWKQDLFGLSAGNDPNKWTCASFAQHTSAL